MSEFADKALEQFKNSCALCDSGCDTNNLCSGRELYFKQLFDDAMTHAVRGFVDLLLKDGPVKQIDGVGYIDAPELIKRFHEKYGIEESK